MKVQVEVELSMGDSLFIASNSLLRVMNNAEAVMLEHPNPSDRVQTALIDIPDSKYIAERIWSAVRNAIFQFQCKCEHKEFLPRIHTAPDGRFQRCKECGTRQYLKDEYTCKEPE